ncbi:hypothetical protein OF83DRAFT_1177133 [Amylostereum chailletii]|nr:hypothetical protein OF83DRAFT_1177133 [Amylostereum chailletii]
MLQLEPDELPSCYGADPTGNTPGSAPTKLGFILNFMGGNLKYVVYSVVIGVLATLVNQFHSVVAQWILARIFITAKVYSGDIAYDWLIEWYSKKGSFDNLRTFVVKGGHIRPSGSSAFVVDGEHDEHDERKAGHNKKLRYLPEDHATMSGWYKGRWMSVTFDMADTNSMLTTSRARVESLILEAKEAHGASNDEIAVYTHDHGFSGRLDWSLIGFQPVRPLDTIILDANAKEMILADAKDFLKSKKWYTTRGIPFRRGYLLYGVPGSGKTSLVHGLAGHLGLDIFVLTLSYSGLDDASLKLLISSLPERCIVLIEDIDVAFARKKQGNVPKSKSGSKPRGTKEDEPAEDEEDDLNLRDAGQNPYGPAVISTVTLSGLLNALDGISAQEGRLLFATTNCRNALDPALIRPGRMDIMIRFENASRAQARALFEHFYLPDSLEASDALGARPSRGVGSGLGSAGACVSIEKVSPDSEEGNLVDLSDDTPLQSPSSGLRSQSAVSGDVDAFSVNEPVWSAEAVRLLAGEFAEKVPDRRVSMAALQGFLMAFKTRPRGAVLEVEGWLAYYMQMQEEREQEEEGEREGEDDGRHGSVSRHAEEKAEGGEATEECARGVKEWGKKVATSENLRDQDETQSQSTSSRGDRPADVLSEADVDALMDREFGQE